MAKAASIYFTQVFRSKLSGKMMPSRSHGIVAKTAAARSISMPMVRAPKVGSPGWISDQPVMSRAKRETSEKARKSPAEMIAKRAGMDEKKRFMVIIDGEGYRKGVGFARRRP